MIITFSYNAGYAKHRGVKKPSFPVSSIFKAASLDLSSGGLFYSNCVFCVFYTRFSCY